MSSNRNAWQFSYYNQWRRFPLEKVINICSTDQGIASILWKRELHYLVHKSQSPVSSEPHEYSPHRPNFFKMNFNIILPASGFPTENFRCIYRSHVYYLSTPLWFNHSSEENFHLICKNEILIYSGKQA